jgi:hypothetical protein
MLGSVWCSSANKTLLTCSALFGLNSKTPNQSDTNQGGASVAVLALMYSCLPIFGSIMQ